MHSHCPLEEHDVLRRRCESQNESPSDDAENKRKDDEVFMLVQSRSRALLRSLCADARGAEIAKLRVALRVLVGSDESQPKSSWGSYTTEVADILQACHADANDAAVIEVETIGGEALGRAAAAAVGIGRALRNIARLALHRRTPCRASKTVPIFSPTLASLKVRASPILSPVRRGWPRSTGWSLGWCAHLHMADACWWHAI